VFIYIGDSLLGTQPFLVIEGNYTGEGTKTFATWNMASLLQPRELVDGVDGSNLRVEMIAAQLGSFHFVCGQEMDGAGARILASKLSNDFAEFYTYTGKSNLPMIPSGLFFASKEKVISVNWTQYQGKDVQTSIRRGVAIFELQNYYVAVTHPDTGTDAEQTRLEEAQQCMDIFATLTNKPIIFCGDFNDDRYLPTSIAYQLITKTFPDAIGNSSKDLIVTCTDRFKHDRFAETTPIELDSIDFIGSNKLQISFIGLEYFYPLSDHSLIKGQLPKIDTAA
jgi:endonuclease/exonuclease/phosphatase family metal-dependent hydrolase